MYPVEILWEEFDFSSVANNSPRATKRDLILIFFDTFLMALSSLETSLPFLVIAELNLPFIYLIAIAQSSILGSINKCVSMN